MAEIVLITGMSGAGRSAAADVLEDLGWYAVDNLPASLVEKVVELASIPGSGIDRLALAGRNYGQVLDTVATLRTAGHRVTVLFLDAHDAELVRRYDATRRVHPLAAEADGLVESIQLERSLLDGTRDAADLVIDTSDLNIHQLKDRLVAAFADDPTQSRLQVAVESFGFKHGLPLDADIVMDVRFLPNPHWEEELRPLTGHDPAVRDFVLERADTAAFIDRLDDLLRTILPAYESEGRSYLTVAIGCTGGRHRSVAIAEELASRLRARGTAVRTTHRDIAR